MANSLTTRLDALEAHQAETDERLAKAEKKAKEQHGTIVALQTALKDKDK